MVKRTKSASSTTSSSSASTGASKREREISAAGREIEHALGLASDTDILARWMVYRLAEMRAAIDTSVDRENARSARAEHDALIMALWAKRRDIPGGVAVDRLTGPAAAMIEALVDEAAPWLGNEEPVAGTDILTAMGKRVRLLAGKTGAMLLQQGEMREGQLDPDLPLEEDERAAHERLQTLRAMVLKMARAREHVVGAPLLSPEDQLAILEQAVREDLDILAALVEGFRTALFGSAGEAVVARGPKARRRRKPAKDKAALG